MSTIPPSFLGSILQTHGAQSRTAEARRREEAAQRERIDGQTFAEGLQNIIENDDRDSSVSADAEGSGSQGRASQPPADESTPPSASLPEPAGGGLDIQA